jgi:hypothetical protein
LYLGDEPAGAISNLPLYGLYWGTAFGGASCHCPVYGLNFVWAAAGSVAHTSITAKLIKGIVRSRVLGTPHQVRALASVCTRHKHFMRLFGLAAAATVASLGLNGCTSPGHYNGGFYSGAPYAPGPVPYPEYGVPPPEAPPIPAYGPAYVPPRSAPDFRSAKPARMG